MINLKQNTVSFTMPLSFTYFADMVARYAVELYATDTEGEPFTDYDENDLSADALEKINLVCFQFWKIVSPIVDVYLNDINSTYTGKPLRTTTKAREDAEDMEILDQFAVWFAASWSGVGICFTDTILTAVKVPREDIYGDAVYDESECQELLNKVATTYFHGEVSIYLDTENDELNFDCTPEFTLKWSDFGGGWRTSPSVRKI